MCRLETEGTAYGCGHYIITRKVNKIDCDDRFCMKSSEHPRDCIHCPYCSRYFEPDSKETVTSETVEYCHTCSYWFIDSRSPTMPSINGFP